MNNDMAKAISISSIWIATAIMFAFGIFQFSWNGDAAIVIMLVVSVAILLASVLSTRAIIDSGTKNKDTNQ